MKDYIVAFTGDEDYRLKDKYNSLKYDTTDEIAFVMEDGTQVGYGPGLTNIPFNQLEFLN